MAADRQDQRHDMFQAMLRPALERLAGKDPEEIAAKTAIAFHRDRQVFSLVSLGQALEIAYPSYAVTPALPPWHQLLLLHYLDLADAAPLTGQLMPFGSLPSGMVRGGGFDRQSEQTLGLRLGQCPQEAVERACRALGGTLQASNADVCAVFSLFPRYPITMKLWFADEDIPGSGRLLLDKSAGHYLSVEDAVTAGTLVLEALLAAL